MLPVETGLHRDVAAQGFNLQLGIVQSLLDHVTDADEADKLIVINIPGSSENPKILR